MGIHPQLCCTLFAFTLCNEVRSSNIVPGAITSTDMHDTDAAADEFSLLQTGLQIPHLTPASLHMTGVKFASEDEIRVKFARGDAIGVKFAREDEIGVKFTREDENAYGKNLVSTENCQAMENHGAYFSIQVRVGSPSQPFDVVADTGSSAFVVPDCTCDTVKGCSKEDKCFKKKNSASFFLETPIHAGDKTSPEMTLGYGSGKIQCIVGSDHVHIAGSHAFMDKSVYLMVSRSELQVAGPFEGILGMGLPEAPGLNSTGPAPFLKQAKVDRYSLCFNEKEAGALRMDIPPLENPMGNIGTVHWGLELQGMSVGDTSTTSGQVLFCDPSTKGAEMDTACGGIPDSGTTLMLGPAEHIIKLYEAICNQWPRCSDVAFTSDMIGGDTRRKSMAFHDLLSACHTWVNASSTAEDVLAELPPVRIHLAGANSEKRVVEISPLSYVILTEEPQIRNQKKHIFGGAVVENNGSESTTELRCTAAFAPQDYVTEKNGPVWILGAPLFFDNVVSYDLSQNPVALAINPGTCHTCGTSLLAESQRGRQRQRNLRHVPKFRYPSIDVTKPL